MSGKLRVVHVGCGGIAGAWLKNEFLRDRIEMVGLVDLDIEAARKTATERFDFPDAEIGTDLEAMLEKTSPDIVFDCTVPPAHAPVTLTALKHGCHVLGEKPMADTLENAKRMVAAATETGKFYAVTQTRRYLKHIRRLKAFLESGAIGTVHTVESQFFIGAHFGGFRAVMPHVLIVDMAVHSFDQARLITGADSLSVYAEEWNPPHSWYERDGSAVAFFNMSGGLRYLYHGSWCAEGCNTTWDCAWRIHGTRGAVLWDGGEGFTAEVIDPQAEGFMKPKTPVEVPEIDPGVKDGGHGGVIREFLDCVEAGREPETICTDNVKSFAMVMGAVASSESGRRVDIEAFENAAASA